MNGILAGMNGTAAGVGLFDFAIDSASALAPSRSASHIATALGRETGVAVLDESLLQLPPVGSKVAANIGKRAQKKPEFGATRIDPQTRDSFYWRNHFAGRADEPPAWTDQIGSSPPSRLDVIGNPSLKLYYDAGAAVIELRRSSRYASYLTNDDMDGMMQMGQDVLNLLMALSQGPYDKKDLSELNHPYGIDTDLQSGQRSPRRLARFHRGKSIGHTGSQKGHGRGTVPSLTVVNSQSGKFARSWELDFRLGSDGISLIWRNTARTKTGFPYAWALATGTTKMRAHGPFTYAPLSRLSQIDQQWRRAVAVGWQRQQQDEAMERFVRSMI